MHHWRVRALQLQQRRHALLARSGTQRAAVATAWSALARPLRWLDGAWRVAGQLRTRPWLLVLPALVLAWLGPRRVGGISVVLPLLLRLWLGTTPRNANLQGPCP
jgi:hypothetical protein